VGIITSDSCPENLARLGQMTECLRHESSYTTGIYSNDAVALFAGWVCRPASYCDCIPVWNETRDICLIFAGEHYSDLEESARLKAAGHVFSPDDASSLVHLYEELGPKFFEALNGTFSGLLVDLRHKKLFLFNDRFGLGRIYYHEGEDGFYFASEAKALLK